MSEVVFVAEGKMRRLKDEALSAALVRAVELQGMMRELEPEYSELREFISTRAKRAARKGGSVSFRSSGVVCTVSPRLEAVVPEENVAALRRLLGRRFGELVKTRHSGSLALLEERGIRELLVLKELSPRFRLERLK